MIPANDFKRQWEEIGEDARRAFESFGQTGWYILGESVLEFERDLAEFWGLKHAIGVASGLDAIEISLRALGCSAGDRVLTTPVSAFATTLAILKLGAVPVFVDTDESGLVDLMACCSLLKRRRDIRYFVPVHLYGFPIASEALAAMRKEFGVSIVEDCAQSIGASATGRPTGTAGELTATSFYPTKNLGAFGDGGAILTNDDSLAARVRSLRDYGQTAKYRHEYLGYNSRLDELQAAILRQACLPRLSQWTSRRRAIAARYCAEIRNERVRICVPPLGSEPCWHLFPVFVAPDLRNDLMQHLKQCGVMAGIHYPVAIPDQPALAGALHELADACSTARLLCSSEVSLPIHPYLSSEEVDRVVDAVNEWRK
jgi:dTDP-4-amino-4,6-dideoxygalactose transaminase